MIVYDIDTKWREVRKHLNDPVVQTALDLGMLVYTEGMSDLPGPWQAVQAPWMFTFGDHWDYKANELFEASDEFQAWMRWSESQEPSGDLTEVEAWYNSDAAKHVLDYYNELCAAYYPQPATPDWYRCYGAEHFLGSFNAALGMQLAPHLDWRVVSGRRYTTAIGYEGGHSILCFDILNSQKPAGWIMKQLKPVRYRLTVGEDLANLRHVLGKGHV
jgi:hypothetical protein